MHNLPSSQKIKRMNVLYAAGLLVNDSIASCERRRKGRGKVFGKENHRKWSTT